jgi:hypothetical protein
MCVAFHQKQANQKNFEKKICAFDLNAPTFADRTVGKHHKGQDNFL